MGKLNQKYSTFIKALSESEASECMHMVKDRNQTSHIYHFEIAEHIAGNVPQAYYIMKTIADRLVHTY